ncbi:hypothetical protein HY029_04085 [Candidatus Gottesmanbacteria bacterium]|nr:hypothetical protein [Candidatus Gottesmanbacteria bacterium]
MSIPSPLTSPNNPSNVQYITSNKQTIQDIHLNTNNILNQNSNSHHLLRFIVQVFSTLFILVVFFFFILPLDTIEVKDQVVTDSIIISTLRIHESAHVIIRLSNQNGRTIGQSRLLSPGTYKDLPVLLFADHPVFSVDQKLFAIVISSYNFDNLRSKVHDENTPLLRDIFGRQIKAHFKLK